MSGPVDLGQTYRYRHTVTNVAGAPANAGTVTATVTLPDGTSVSPNVVNSSTGVYDIAYTTTQAGLHQLSGAATGGVLGPEVDVWGDAFTVEPAGRMLVGVDEASAHLRPPGSSRPPRPGETARCAWSPRTRSSGTWTAFVPPAVTETHSGVGRDPAAPHPGHLRHVGHVGCRCCTRRGICWTQSGSCTAAQRPATRRGGPACRTWSSLIGRVMRIRRGWRDRGAEPDSVDVAAVAAGLPSGAGRVVG